MTAPSEVAHTTAPEPLSTRARNRRASSAMLRERILNAAEAEFTRQGLTSTTVDDIAAAADVSRATLYRQFPSRDEIALSVLLREVDRISGQLLAHVSRYERVEDIITEGMLLCVRTIRDDPILSVLFSPEAAASTASIAGGSDAFYARAHHFGRILLELTANAETDQVRSDLDIADIADHIVRTILAFLVMPAPNLQTEDDQRRYIHNFIVPVAVQARPT